LASEWRSSFQVVSLGRMPLPASSDLDILESLLNMRHDTRGGPAVEHVPRGSGASCAPVARQCAPVSSGLERTRADRHLAEQKAIRATFAPAKRQLWATERRRSRTYPAWGYQTSPVLKVYLARSIWLRKRGFRPASVRLDPVGSAETGTKSGTKFSRLSGARLCRTLEVTALSKAAYPRS
jgi:hypothetical protein